MDDLDCLPWLNVTFSFTFLFLFFFFFLLTPTPPQKKKIVNSDTMQMGCAFSVQEDACGFPAAPDAYGFACVYSPPIDNMGAPYTV